MNHLTSDLLDLYLDGRLDAQARAAAEIHLATCVHCREEVAALRYLFQDLAALPPEPLPIDLAPLVLARIAPAAGAAPHLSAGARGAAPADQPFVVRGAGGSLMAGQIALIALLMAWFGSDLLAWATPTLPDVPALAASDAPFQLSLWLDQQVSAVQASLVGLEQTGDMFVAGLLADIPTIFWILAVAMAGVVWLISNRLLLGAAYRPTHEVA